MIKQLLLTAILWVAALCATFGQCSWHLQFGTPVCNGNGSYNVQFSCTPSSNPTVSAGTINWNNSTVENVPAGTNVVITGNYDGCQMSRTCTAPSCGGGGGCNGSPSLSLGSPVCNGATLYNVTFTAQNGAAITSTAGSVQGNQVLNIAVGTNAVITASLNGCSNQATVYSPSCGGGGGGTETNLQNITSFVGINTNNNGSKLGEQFWLAVRGKILAEEIRVRTGWADDVFTPTYKLSSLATVERYIRHNGHLPGIPSAAHVEANGIQVGEMHSLLLRKIEELTLHVIRQQREINQLRKQNKRRSR